MCLSKPTSSSISSSRSLRFSKLPCSERRSHLPNEPGVTLDVPQVPVSGHQQSASISNGYITNPTSGATTIGGLLALGPRGQHNRAVSLPVLAPEYQNGGVSPSSLQGGAGADGERRGHQYQASFGSMGPGFGLAIGQNGLNGWVEEEVAN